MPAPPMSTATTAFGPSTDTGMVTGEAAEVGLATSSTVSTLASAEAKAALRKALSTAPADLKPGILGSLGNLRDAVAVGEIGKLVDAERPEIAAAAILALGRIGDAAAAAALTTSRSNTATGRWNGRVRNTNWS